MMYFMLASVLVSSCICADLNFDPGFTIQNAAYWRPSNPYYFEDCPSAGGQCYGVLPKGGGFYTLSYDADHSGFPFCTPNSRAIITDPEFPRNHGEVCPYYFHWGADPTGPFSRLIVDMKDWNVQTRVYFGIQENMVGDYDGLPPNYLIPAWSIRFLEITYRTKVCFPSDPNIFVSGNFPIYMTFHDRVTQRSIALRLNLIAYYKAPPGSTPPDWYALKTWNEAWYPGNPNPDVNTWNLNGLQWGLTDDWNSWIDPTGQVCSTPIEQSPWRTYRIDVHSVYNGMINDGWEPKSYFDTADWVGSIVGGTEIWGQGYAAVDVKGYRLIG